MRTQLCLLILGALLFTNCKPVDTLINGSQDISLNLTPNSIFEGESATLSWNVKNARKGTIISLSGAGDSLPLSGQTMVSPVRTRDYTLTASSDKKRRKKVSKSTTLEVKKRPIASISDFGISPKTIVEGKSAKISWNLDDFSDEKLVIEGTDETISSATGSISVSPTENQSYTLKVYKNDEIVAEETVSIVVKEYIPPVGFSTGPDDGRFTIGGNGKRLMYGWPVSKSTSHFVVKVDKSFGANYKGLTRPDNIYYITGDLEAKGIRGSIYDEISYYLDGVKITQRLIPVDWNFKRVELNTFGQYYKIEYELENSTEEEKSVGLFSLIDFMLDTNDGSQSEVDGNRVEMETEITKENMPDDFIVYQEYGNKEVHAGKVVLNQEAVKPDLLYIGKWPYYHSVIWDIETEGDPYGDSGMLLKWDEAPLKPGEKRECSFYYGLLQEGKVTAVTTDEELEEEKTVVYFDMNSSRLNKKARQILDSTFIQVNTRGTVRGALISGYADAVGDTDFNLKLSNKRVKTVTEYLAKKGVDFATIIPKAYGESTAEQSEETEKSGKDDDRKCEITIYSVNN